MLKYYESIHLFLQWSYRFWNFPESNLNNEGGFFDQLDQNILEDFMQHNPLLSQSCAEKEI